MLPGAWSIYAGNEVAGASEVTDYSGCPGECAGRYANERRAILDKTLRCLILIALFGIDRFKAC
jgi:hypothetical protein